MRIRITNPENPRRPYCTQKRAKALVMSGAAQWIGAGDRIRMVRAAPVKVYVPLKGSEYSAEYDSVAREDQMRGLPMAGLDFGRFMSRDSGPFRPDYRLHPRTPSTKAERGIFE